MNIDYGELAQKAVDFLKPHLIAAGDKLADQALENAGSGVAIFYHWLKARFTKPAAAGALEDATHAPAVGENWEALRVQILKALKEDGDFRNEFQKLLPKSPATRSVTQKTSITGSQNINLAISGKKNKINIHR